MNGAAGRLTAAERTAAASVTGLACAMLFAYVTDRLGGAIHPFPIVALSTAAAAAITSLAPRSRDRGDLLPFLGVIAVVAAFLLQRSWPWLLPPGAGSDLTHHLQLIGFIERDWRLPHAPADAELIGNMVNYTPGSHLLAAMAGRVMSWDGLHAVYPLIVFAVALKAGLVFLIARRVLTEERGRTALALTAVAILALPYDYSLGSFLRWSFVAQVVSETCAVAMWWALVLWDQGSGRTAAVLFGLAGAGAYLAWPVWIGPPAFALAMLFLAAPAMPPARRAADACLALAPIAAIAILHAAGRVSSIAIVRSGGASFELSAARFGWTLLILSGAGAVLALRRREARATLLVLTGIAAQTAALFVVAGATGADSPYMARKMAHLAVLPMAAASALTLAALCRAASRVVRPPRAAWIVLIAVSAAAVRTVTTMPRQAPVITEDLFRAGVWARDHAPRACVDYLVASDDSSYWLHHAVLGNPMHPPSADLAPVFFYREAITRWVEGKGRPLAIADLDIVPKEVRDEIEPMARSGSIVAGRHRGVEPCRAAQ